jgi:hypothetical protein
MKTITICLLAFLVYGLSQNSHLFSKNTDFSLIFSTFNHSELIFKGQMIYKLKNDSFTIIRRTIFEDSDSLVFSKTIEKNLVTQIMAINLDTLQNYYFNKCILSTSGTEYEVSIRADTVSKTIYLHHFYHKEIDRLIVVINKIAPNKYKIDNIARNTKQNCK